MTDAPPSPTPGDVPIAPDTPEAETALEREEDQLSDRVQDMDWTSARVRLTTHTAMLAIQRYARVPGAYDALSAAIREAAGELVDENAPVDVSTIEEDATRILAKAGVDFSSPEPVVSYLGQPEPEATFLGGNL